MPTNKKHYFVIVNYNSGDYIIDCIDSILQSQNIRPYIIIVDNASRDNSLEACKSKFPNLTYIYNSHNIGFAAGANIGARLAIEKGAETVTFCNPDVILEKTCANLLISAISSHQADIISPIIYTQNTHNIWFSGGHISFYHMRATHTNPLPTANIITNIDYISGCVMMVSAKVFNGIGFFDENFFLYYEDADFSLRAKEADLILGILPQAKAYHAEVSENNLDQKTYFLVLSGLIFFNKHTKGLKRIWFHIHTTLRKIKNYFDRKKNKLISHSVRKAYQDYATRK